MTKDDILNSIKYSLGYPRIDIEIEDDVIESFIDVSISKISDYADTTKFITLPALSCQDFKLGTVINIYNNDDTLTLNSSFDDSSNYMFDETKVTLYSTGGNFRYRKQSILQQASQNLNMSVKPKSFKQVGNKLYIYNLQGEVAVEYIPKDFKLEYFEPSLVEWVRKYSLALCKESIGRIRSKYRSNSGPFEMDGDTLVNEALDTQNMLLDDLDSKGYGFFYVDTD